MKHALTFLLLLTATTFGQARLEWDDPNPVGLVKEFKVWNVAGATPALITTTTQKFHLLSPQPGTYSMAISAVAQDGTESLRSTNKLFSFVLAPITLRVSQ